jgi:hypothetical protein
MMTATTPAFRFAAVPKAARSALQWRLLLLWAIGLLLPTLAVALPFLNVLGNQLDHSVHVGALAQELDMTALADLMAALQRDSGALAGGAVVAFVLTLLVSPLLTGMVIAAARAELTLGFHGLFAGGLREYPRMLRMLAWALVPLGICIAIGGAAMDAASKYAGKAILASEGEHATMAATVLLGVLLLLAHATIDAARALLATDRRRRSVVKAWWAGCKLLARRPLATLGVYLAISVVGLLLAAVLLVARINVPHVSVVGVIGAFVLTELAVVIIAWMRSARLFAMIDLARSTQA